ncbi:MAG: ATP-binding cassette domain-containing protein, partial [Comamonadaceae bacterium]
MPDPLFEARDLTKRYGDTIVVDGLSFGIEPGECLGVIGPNGAGKTTTIRMCLGLTAPAPSRRRPSSVRSTRPSASSARSS